MSSSWRVHAIVTVTGISGEMREKGEGKSIDRTIVISSNCVMKLKTIGNTSEVISRLSKFLNVTTNSKDFGITETYD